MARTRALRLASFFDPAARSPRHMPLGIGRLQKPTFLPGDNTAEGTPALLVPRSAAPSSEPAIKNTGGDIGAGMARSDTAISRISAASAPQAHSITINASATLLNGVGAYIGVFVDGVRVGTAVVGAKTENFTFTAKFAAGVGHDIRVVYSNDRDLGGHDRNLTLNWIQVNGHRVAATSSYEVYHAAGQGNLASDGAMNWNGTAEFKLPASMFGGSAPPAPATGFYVSTTGSDSGDGSVAHPFATLGRAVTAMEQSGSIKATYLEGGTYKLGSTVNLGSKDSGMTIESAPGAKAVLDGNGSLSTLVSLNGASNVTLQGLTFQDTGKNAAALSLSGASGNHIVGNLFSGAHEGILLANGSSSNTVSGNELDNSGTSGIEDDGQSNSNTFDSNLINGAGAVGTTGGGIFVHGANNNVISHNQVENTAGMGIGLENWDSSTVNVGNKIIDNDIHNVGTSSQSVDTGAIYLLGRSDVNTQTTISGNDITSTLSTANHPQIVGIYLDDLTSGVTVTNNIVANTVDHSLQIHGGSNVTVENNIFDLGANSGSSWGWDTAALFQSISGHGMSNNVFSHNIIASTSSTPAAYSNLNGGTPTINDNFYMDLLNSHFQTFGTSLAETNAHYGNALFANEAAGNYNLASNSPAFAAGFTQINQSVMGLHPTTAHWYS
jgi:parallel beta-helix repeat protein